MPVEASIITTYRCCMKCKMCHIWKFPTRISEEIRPEELKILPSLNSINVTGGEPLVRRDLAEIVEVCFTKAPRVVISTAGYHVDEILALAERFPKIGIRISIEGLSTINDHLRGRDSGFDRGLRTLLGLRRMGVKDIGFGITVSNNNSSDMLELYELSRNLKMEFATATYHNSYYFHKDNNKIVNEDEVTGNFYELCDRLLAEKSPKSWFRAFFNMGLINYIDGNRRLLPCEAGTTNFFIEPYGEVYPCNGLEEKYWKEQMGNIREVKTFEELWYSEQAEKVRALVATCPKNCWMIGTAAPVMKKYLKHPVKWVVKNKIRALMGKKVERGCLPGPYDVGQNPSQGDLRGSAENPVGEPDEVTQLNESRMAARVISNTQLLDDVHRLRIERSDFQFTPGQNVSLSPHLKYHKTRDYTMVSGAADNYIEFLIKEVKNGVMSPFLSQLLPGDSVNVIGPYGEFCIPDPLDSGRKYLFIGSGIGVGPFQSFVRSYPGIDYKVIHGIRFKADSVMAEDFAEDRYITCVTREEGGDFHGRITDYLKDHEIDENTLVFLCGNPHMVSQVHGLLIDRGIEEERILTETYYTY